MKALWLVRHGTWEIRESADPQPKAGEVRIQVRATGLNFAELMASQGLYPDAPKLPAILGYEAAGTIDAVGEGVDASRVGERVVALVHFGAHAQYCCVPSQTALPIPDTMPFEAAAALPVTYLTAYHLLFFAANLREKESVLVHMAAGGVGTAVLQLCRTVPGIVTFGTASASKHDRLREYGCTHPIDYHAVDYAAEVRRLTDNRGVDVVLDPLGGGDTRKGYRLLRAGGRIIVYGFANLQSRRRNVLHLLGQLARVPRFSPLQLMSANKGIVGVNIGHLWSRADLLLEEMHALLGLYEQGKIAPVIDAVLPLERGAEAYARIASAANVGKVILTIGGTSERSAA
ncbi:MAG TPA: medium chain dehydrogenase/reductase family protein [Candidatus Baltobacteraceae bacterium]|nr:medium chain dehydrogenase/reductase family protein [Candidatus Baltobacteraceae bacterium]